MAHSDLKRVLAHWNKLFEEFHTPASTFYHDVENATKRRQIRGVHFSREFISEGPSGSRQYLRVRWRSIVVDICAAPFGTGYFFSSWLWRRPTYWGFTLCLATLLSLGVLWLRVRTDYWLWDLPARFVIWKLPLFGFWLAGSLLIAWLFHRWSNKPTYYKIDTAIMFQKTVHGALLEVIDGLTTAHGIRSLSESERAPVYRELAGAVGAARK